MKTVFTGLNGALTITENEGVFTLGISDAASIGGGPAAGIAKVSGSANLVLDTATGLKLAESLLNSHLPAALVPFAEVAESVGNQAIAAAE